MVAPDTPDAGTSMHALCRDCLTWFDDAPAGRCPACARPRLIAHPELPELSVAHLDCDAFYASVEKRDDPALRNKPVIVGGGRRGVVSTCCYIARVAGVRSAMPMFKALKLCPDAVVVRPRMAVYEDVGRAIRERMRTMTPLVEPLSLDEAFMDLSGTERLLGRCAAVSMAALAREVEAEFGITVSVGLSHNKYLAKIASDLDKPRGFSVIGRAETLDFLAPRPVRSIWGVGKAMADRLEADGYHTNADLRAAGDETLMRRYGESGQRLARLSRGEDARRVSPDSAMKSISSETTFNEDIGAVEPLAGHLWRLAVKTSDRAKAKETVGQTVVLKLKTTAFRTITRQARVETPTNLADILYSVGEPLLLGEIERGPFRLIGIGLTTLEQARPDDPVKRLFQDDRDSQAEVERATDRIRARFGTDAIIRGRSLR